MATDTATAAPFRITVDTGDGRETIGAYPTRTEARRVAWTRLRSMQRDRVYGKVEIWNDNSASVGPCWCIRVVNEGPANLIGGEA